MKATDSIPDIRPYVKGAVENDYAIEQLLSGADSLRSAFERSRKRRIDPIEDRKVHRQLEAGLAALAEGTRALSGGREHPRRHWLRRLGLLAALAGVGAAGFAARNAIGES